MEWYDSGDGLIADPGRVTGSSGNPKVPAFTTLTVTSTAPSNAVKVTIGITASTIFTSEVVYIDNAQESGPALPEWGLNASVFVFPLAIAIISVVITRNRHHKDKL